MQFNKVQFNSIQLYSNLIKLIVVQFNQFIPIVDICMDTNVKDCNKKEK